MKHSWIAILFTQLFLLNSAWGVLNSCHENLDPELKYLIISDKDSLADMYYLSLLKLSLALAQDEHQKNILKERIQDVSEQQRSHDFSKFSKLIDLNYQKYAKTLTRKKASESIHDNSVTLNKVSSSYVLSQDSECREYCLTEEDEGLFWLVKEIEQGRNSGDFSKLNMKNRPKFYLGGDEAQASAKELQSEIQLYISKLVSEFNTREQLCGGVEQKQNCTPFQEKNTIDSQVEQMFSLLSEGAYKLNLKAEEKKKVNAKLLKDLSADSPESKDEESWEYDNSKQMCGPVEFEPRIENKEIYGFSDPRAAFKGGKDVLNTYKKSGIAGLKKLSNESSGLKSSGKSKFNGASLLSKFQIPGPMFRCEPESPIAIPKFGMLSADKTVCCNESVESRKLRFYFINWGGGFGCRAFFGLPYIAEVGAKLGVGLNLILSGGVEPEQCLEKSCIKASPMFNVSASLYAEVLAGTGSIQGTISWMPYASIQQCITESNNLPPADINYQVGRVLAIVSVRLGWAFSYNDVKPIYESNKNTHTSFPIF
ncbi:MAG: hypothetical protein KC478_04295 [Bacteriovoracaceae bacterium]|nr:hypothetical protein [Bacteriovoracaceae bacterium]